MKVTKMSYSYTEKQSQNFQTAGATRSVEVELDKSNPDDVQEFRTLCEEIKTEVQDEVFSEVGRLSALRSR